MSLRRVRRIAVYGVCSDDAGRVLMVAPRVPEGISAAPSAAGTPDVWNLPGGGIWHGEDPGRAITRKVKAETGLVVTIDSVREIAVEVREDPERGFTVHTDQIIYDVLVAPGADRTGTHRVAWLSAEDLRAVPLTDRARAVLAVPGEPEKVRAAWDPPEVRSDRGQRFSAYGVVTDSANRVLLTLISPGYPGAGTWHLPGGGTEFGEEPAEAVLREMLEETGQVGRITGLIGVTNLHNPAAWGPEGRPMNWHGVRVAYRVEVDDPTVPIVRESDGSTADAGWFTLAEAAQLRLNRPAAEALRKANLLLR